MDKTNSKTKMREEDRSAGFGIYLQPEGSGSLSLLLKGLIFLKFIGTIQN